MSARYSPGDVLLASLIVSSQEGTKNRPVIVVYDASDDDLLVAPITSHAGRSQRDVSLDGWKEESRAAVR